jgi:hypothetical protein
LALVSEREKLRAPLAGSAELFRLRVKAVEYLLVASDLGLELGPPAAVPPVQVLELALRSRELCGRVLVLPIELPLLLSDPLESGVAASALDEGERLGGRVLEGAGGAFGRCGRIRPAERRLAFQRITVGEVEAGLGASAAAGDVAPLL